MLRSCIVASALLLLLCDHTKAWCQVQQQDSTTATARIKYSNALFLGAQFAQSTIGNSITLSTQHGVRYKRFFAGAGIGYDEFPEWRSVPFFASLAADVLRIGRTDALFVQVSGGICRVWHPVTDNDFNTFENAAGKMIHPMLGFRHSSGLLRLYITAGYKLQRLNYDFYPRWWIWWPPSYRTSVEHNIDRLVVQIGIGLN
jgi:hypothetical protein